MDDKSIIELFFERDESSIKEIADKYGRLCRKIAFEILKNEQDTEECINTAYVKLWNSIPPKNPESLKGFLCAIVRNTAFDTYSASYRLYSECYDELSDIIADNRTVESSIDSKELGKAINGFIEKQNKTNSNIFVSRYYFGMSFEAISEQLGINVNAVQKRLSRMRIELRRYLNKRGFEI
ncbi:MAG: RNA polymerase sigma factor [Ruminiclostridium sp.]